MASFGRSPSLRRVLKIYPPRSLTVVTAYWRGVSARLKLAALLALVAFVATAVTVTFTSTLPQLRHGKVHFI